MFRKLVLTGAIVGLLALVLFQSVSGFIGRNTFEPEAVMDRSGRLIWVTAQITCSAGERLTVEARLSQERMDGDRYVGALAEGRSFAICESDDPDNDDVFQEVTIVAVARGREPFVPDEVVATGLAITRDRGNVTAVRQWQPDNPLNLEYRD